MAQKTLGQETAGKGLNKSHKAASPVEGVTAAEIVMKAPQLGQQGYPEVNAAIDRGLADVAAGRVHRMSFAEYADIPTDD